MKNLKDNSILLEESSVTTAEVPNNVNISKYVEMIQSYIQRKNNSLTTSTSSSDNKRPELVLASRLSENPISVIDRTADSIYRIKIEKVNKSNDIDDKDIIINRANSNNASICNTSSKPDKCEMYLYITLYDTNDVLQMEHTIVYQLDHNYQTSTNGDKLFSQFLPGIFINQIY